MRWETSTRWTPTTTASTWCTSTRFCSIWPIRSRRSSRCDACAALVAWLPARDSDYPTIAWHPHPPELAEWLALYTSITRANGGSPDAGRLLLSWAQRAGFTDITPSASAWCFATPGEREWWAGLWADRVVESSLAEQAVDGGFASPDDLERISVAWRKWASHEDGWFAMLHGEILAVA